MATSSGTDEDWDSVDGSDWAESVSATTSEYRTSSDGDTTSSSSSEADVEIEINNTPEASDDLVRLKSTIPDKRFTTPCRIRVLNRHPDTDIAVTLTNPDGRLRFPLESSLTLTLPADGSWVAFAISGHSKSNHLGDAAIVAERGTRVEAQANVTVFHFEPSDITIGRGSAYAWNGTIFQPNGERSAANFSASAVLKPAGVSCDAPQVAHILIGIVQNGTYAKLIERYIEPVAIVWANEVPAGTSIEVPAEVEVISELTGAYNDSRALVAPLYDQGGKAPDTFDEDSLKPPAPCAGSKRATSNDAPFAKLSFPKGVPRIYNDGQGRFVALYQYQQAFKIRYTVSLTTWCVTFDDSDAATPEIIPLRQTEWGVDVDSSRSALQYATVPTTDHEPTWEPETGGLFFNTHLDALVPVISPAGSATVFLSKPW